MRADHRKSKSDRSASAGRQKLLDAAVICLIESGVAGTTTLAVQRRAGVSRGALLHHFPSHALLLAATVAELVERNERAVQTSELSRGNGSGDLLDRAVRSLAFAARQPAYLAELELWAVSRTDEALRRALIAAERSAKRDIDRVHSELFGRWAESEAYEKVVSLTHHFIHGLAISENIRISPRRRDRLIAAWTDAIRSLLEQNTRKQVAQGA